MDLLVLWPVCKAQTSSLDEAKGVFAVHAFNDPCWYRYYKGELDEIIDKLE